MFTVYIESLFIYLFYHGFMIYIYIYNYNKCLFIQTLKFYKFYDGHFSNFNCYKYLCNNATKHLKIMYKSFLKYALKYK